MNNTIGIDYELENKARTISQHIQEYLKEENKTEAKPKDVMPFLILKGDFSTDNIKGNPLRKLLRKLDDENRLDLIQGLFAERKRVNTYWYLRRVL